MDRPRYVSDAIATSENGVHVGHYGHIELFSAFQPIFGAKGTDLCLVGFEGLIRARQNGEELSPAALFANTGSADRLFIECMCRALHLRNYRQAAPADRQLFLNINPAIYESVEVIEREFAFMFSILDRYGVQPGNLVCEVIETEEISTVALGRLCARLREGGALIAVDDFGAGSSGMDRYRALKPDIVKLDGQMFRAAASDPCRLKLVDAMARTFIRDGATILVEGIESAAQLAAAADLGATLFQGYALAAPCILPHEFCVPPGLTLQGRHSPAVLRG